MFLHFYQIITNFLYVCQLAYFLTEIKLIQGYLQFQMRYPSEIFWRQSKAISGPFPNYSEFFVCLSACQLTYFLTESRQVQGYLKFCIRYLSAIFWRHFLYVDTPIPNKSEFLVCLSVCQLTYFLNEIRHIEGYLQLWMRYLFEIFWRISLTNWALF